MFAIHCPVAGGRVLIWSSRIEQVRNVSDGIQLSFRCHCGGNGVLVTGRSRGHDQILHEAPSPLAATA